MTEQNTNGPVQEAVLEAGVLERGAELSAQMVRPQPAAETTPERTAAELRERLELIREVKRTAMTENVDYGVVPGTEKATLFKPGAEKLALVFKLDVQPSNELIWGPSEHLTVISRATVFHAPTGTRLGYGEGICSSRERNRAYRKQERTCPNCEQPAVIKGKEEFGGGWLCWRKKNGCGAKFPDGDQRIESQEVGEIENPDLPDTWNAVDKMAAKRCLGGTTPIVYATNHGITRGLVNDLELILENAGDEPVWLPGADGSWRRILGLEKVLRDDIVRVSLADGTVLRVTPEHRFPTDRGLVTVSELSDDDVLCRGRIPDQSPGDQTAAFDEYGWVAGLFLAEGCYCNRDTSVLFSLHADEEVFVERITAVASALGAHASVRPHGPNGQVVQIGGTSFIGLINQFITGRSSHGKHLTRYAWRQGSAFLNQLLMGYLDGDGHLHTRPGTRQQKWTLGFTGKNVSLAEDLRALCAILGYRISLRRSDARAGDVVHPTFSGWISASTPRFNGRVLEKVVGIEAEPKRMGSVMYDVEVDGDHLFCLGNGIITHNSRVDAVLSVTGASAIFTQDLGADPSDAAAEAEPVHGPVVSGELKQQAREAAIRLCGGDLAGAKTLWEKVQGELGGYMPEAAAKALLGAAEKAVLPTGGAQGAGTQTSAPSDNGSSPEQATQVQEGTERPQPAATEPPTEPPSQPGNPQAPAADHTPAPNPHGARLREIAAARGVSDAELANLIRNAVAQGPIPAERARTALPEMLARITEEISERTIELVELFHPPGTSSEAGTDQSTSVDFGALEPPQAA